MLVEKRMDLIQPVGMFQAGSIKKQHTGARLLFTAVRDRRGSAGNRFPGSLYYQVRPHP